MRCLMYYPLAKCNAHILHIIDILTRREHGIFNRSNTNIDSLSQWCVGVLDLLYKAAYMLKHS